MRSQLATLALDVSFGLSPNVIQEIEEKIKRFKKPKPISIRTALIYVGNLDKKLTDYDDLDYKIDLAQLL